MTTPRHPDSGTAASGETLAGADTLLAQVDRLERELAALGDRLARSERLAAVGSLAAVVAHEVNNVLTPVTSYAQLALDAPEEPALTRKALEQAVEGVARAERITASVLGLTREGSAQTDPSTDGNSAAGEGGDALACGLRETVASALSCLDVTAGLDAIAVETDVVDARVGMPGTDLYRVLVNLLLNARRAVLSSPGRRWIGVKASPVAGTVSGVSGESSDGGEAASWVELVVSDSGPGVPSAVRSRLFEPFATCPVSSGVPGSGTAGDASVSGGAASEGSGLGLAICRELVDRAGGSIVLDSPAGSGGGAVFRLRLPAVG